MFSKSEASELRHEFWTKFGQYMRPVPSAGETKINWVNYKTGVPHIRFSMDADARRATIGLCFSHPPSVRELFTEQMAELSGMFKQIAGSDWQWNAPANNKGPHPTCLQKTLEPVSVFRKTDWPEMIAFFKDNIIALDAFWTEVRPVFEMLG